MSWRAVRFAGFFCLDVLLFSFVLQLPWINDHLVVPFTGLVARSSAFLLAWVGMAGRISGTTISSEGGFAINIVNGCNGLYVMAIVIAAVLAFQATFRQKLIGILMCSSGVQMVNLVRILSLFWIGQHWPEVFSEFHILVWQTGIVVVSMIVWIIWVEAVVSRPARRHALQRS